MAEFTGFPAEGLALLTVLPRRDTAWFKANRPTYEAAVALPAKAFVDALGDRLRSNISVGIVSSPKVNGSIAPINNDVRFSKGKSAYKDHLLFRFWEGSEKKTAPTLFVRLSAKSIGFASGAMFPDVDLWRRRVDDDATGKRLATTVAKLEKKKNAEVVGAELKRVPAPYPAEHPRGDFLRHKMIQVRWPEPTPKAVATARFADWCATRIDACADLHHWLVKNL
jgi:uncharacterized protein (TIGR02453 family)